MKEILSHIISGEDFNVLSYISFLDVFLSANPVAQGYLIVRRNRNIAKGTGAMLSPNDWQLGMSITDYVVLTLYKVTGEKAGITVRFGYRILSSPMTAFTTM